MTGYILTQRGINMTKCIKLQYLGDPIVCMHNDVKEDYAKQYCWLHGSNHIPKKYEKQLSGTICQLQVMVNMIDLQNGMFLY